MYFKDPYRIAKRFNNVPGSKLVGYREIATAVYKLQVCVVLMVPKQLSPIDEFLLRSVQIGIDNADTLVSLLGLERSTVYRHLSSLHYSELIATSITTSDEETLRLTPKGVEAAETAANVQLREEIIPVMFHGFLRRPIPYRTLLNSRECRENGLLQVGPQGKRPQIDELQLNELKPILQQFWQQRHRFEQQPEIVGIKSVSKEGSVLYEPSLLLAYDTVGLKGSKHFAFIVEGEKRDDYATAFKPQLQLPRKLMMEEFKSVSDVVRHHLPPQLHDLAQRADFADGIVEKIEQLEQKLTNAREDEYMAEYDFEARFSARDIQQIQHELKETKAQLDQLIVVPLGVNECQDQVVVALEKCKQTLLIASARLSIRKLRDLRSMIEKSITTGNIQVHIMFEKPSVTAGDRQRSDAECTKLLHGLAERFPGNFKATPITKIATNFIVCDRSFASFGSYHWLSDVPYGESQIAGIGMRTSDQDAIAWFQSEFSRLHSQAVAGAHERSGRGPLSSVVYKNKDSELATTVDLVEDFENYRLLRQLMGGGMSEAYVAERRSDNRTVFLKRVHIESKFVRAIEREQAIYEKLTRVNSKYVIEFLDWVKTDFHLAIVTEFADGGDLKNHVKKSKDKGGLSAREAREIAIEVSLALRELHECDIVHRDLKPDNVLRTSSNWKLTDFGISKNLVRLITRRTSRGYTPGYAAPEQIAGAEAHRSADIYSFGMLIRFIKESVQSPDPQWESIVSECIQNEPRHRPDVNRVIAMLHELALA